MLTKDRTLFFPPEEFRKRARVGNAEAYRELQAAAQRDPVGFWESQARLLHWFTPWSPARALEWTPPKAVWFGGGKLNASYQCLDLILAQGNGRKTAILWEGEEGSEDCARRVLTFEQLHAETCRLANVLSRDLGLKAGDMAALYMPLVPEAIVAMLACARIGVTHNVIFAGFSAQAVRDRVDDSRSRVLLTADLGFRKGSVLPLRETAREATRNLSCVEHILVWKRSGSTRLADNDQDRELDWRELARKASPVHEAPALDSQHPLFLLYTSGTTGKPKGIVHSTGGYLVQATTTARLVLDLQDHDVYWCTADIGWITGHTYGVYGVLGLGCTIFLCEGALSHPTPSRPWDLIDENKITILYTAPTAIRSFMRLTPSPREKHSLKSLRLLGSVGEPINPEAWLWYHEAVGGKKCPIVDTWWQTETGAMLIAPVPGAVATKPGSACLALPGIEADVVDEDGKTCPAGQAGNLVIRPPWPSLCQGLHGDPDGLGSRYLSRFPGLYFTGDGAHRDRDGYFWIQGRLDDVLNVSGHRLGTAEIESALVSHPQVSEAAVVGKPDAEKGQAIAAYVILKSVSRDPASACQLEELRTELKAHVVRVIGAIARPDRIHFTSQLPKTRSGKILRRLLRGMACTETGKAPPDLDLSSLEGSAEIELF